MEGIVSQFAGIYREWAPHASLRGHVRCLSINDLSGSRSESLQVVTDGCVDIVLVRRNTLHRRPRYPAHSLLHAVPRDRCGDALPSRGGLCVAGQPLDEIVNVRAPLAEFWGDDATRLLDRAAAGLNAKQVADDLEACLVRRLAAVGPADPRIAFLRRTAGDNCVPAGREARSVGGACGSERARPAAVSAWMSSATDSRRWTVCFASSGSSSLRARPKRGLGATWPTAGRLRGARRTSGRRIRAWSGCG